MSWDGTGIVCRIGGYCWKNWHGGLAQGCLNSKRKSADYKWDRFCKQGSNAYLIKFPVRAIEMMLALKCMANYALQLHDGYSDLQWSKKQCVEDTSDF